ncbi:hypothetical protein H4Q26_012484 [Puccinia striiformis f. sp. tritici PST-130]|nr:hypothetical protein H4Q26_012484 [Puccinia striiformis f. sp. tritici PST-130]
MNNPEPHFDCGSRGIKLKDPRPQLLFSFLVDTNNKREKKTSSDSVSLPPCRIVQPTPVCRITDLTSIVVSSSSRVLLTRDSFSPKG